MTQTSEAPRPARARLLGGLLVAVVATGAFISTVTYGFVYDDHVLVEHNPWLSGTSHLEDIFSSANFASAQSHLLGANYYRPLVTVTHLLLRRGFGLRPWPFHLVNVLVHGLCSLLVFLLALWLLEGDDPEKRPVRGALGGALAAGLLFALHPLHVEAVAWVSGLADLGATLLVLLALVLHVRSRALFDGRHLLSVLAALVAPFFKEPALALLVIVPLSGPRREDAKRTSLRLLPYLAAAGVYLGLRVHAVGAVPAATQPIGVAAALATAPALLYAYLAKLVVPVGLSAYHAFSPVTSAADPRLWAGLVLAAGLAALFVAGRRNRALRTALALLVVPLLPVLWAPVLGRNAFAERYAYLPSAGFALLVGLAVARASRWRPRTVAAVLGIGSAVLVAFAYQTEVRTAVWQNDVTLWTDATRGAQPDPVPWYNLGLAYWQRGKTTDALRAFEATVERKPDSAKTWNYIGVAQARLGRLDAARKAFEHAAAGTPNAGVLLNLGRVLRLTGHPDEAAVRLRACLRLDPTLLAAHQELGLALLAAGRDDEARVQLEAVLRARPRDAAARRALDLIHRRTLPASGAPGAGKPGSRP